MRPQVRKMRSDSIPYISIRPSYVACYALPESRRTRTIAQKKNDKNLSQNTPNSHISKKANRRIRQAIDWLLYIAEDKQYYHEKHKRWYSFKVNFITLTLSATQNHSDNEIKRLLLRPFLDYARKTWNLEHYVWRAEPQKNGNIHFHICTSVFIPWSELRNTWNRYQSRLGYIRRFQEKHPGKTPNSTDIHAIKKIKNLAAYLSKYCAKENEGRAIQGKQWGLSYSLSRLKSAQEMVSYEITEEIRELWRNHADKVRKDQYNTVIFVNWKQIKKLKLKRLTQTLRDYATQSLRASTTQAQALRARSRCPAKRADERVPPHTLDASQTGLCPVLSSLRLERTEVPSSVTSPRMIVRQISIWAAECFSNPVRMKLIPVGRVRNRQSPARSLRSRAPT